MPNFYDNDNKKELFSVPYSYLEIFPLFLQSIKSTFSTKNFLLNILLIYLLHFTLQVLTLLAFKLIHQHHSIISKIYIETIKTGKILGGPKLSPDLYSYHLLSKHCFCMAPPFVQPGLPCLPRGYGRYTVDKLIS